MYPFLCKLWLLLAGGLIAWLVSGWFARRFKYEQPPVEKIVEKKTEVEKIIDNPEHLALIKKLEADNSQIENLKTRIVQFENAESSVIEKEIDNPVHLKKIDALENEIEVLKQGPSIDLQAARAAGITIEKEDDFSAIEGIGPKINDLIHVDGIRTFRELSKTPSPVIQKILDNAGTRFKMANPGTWPDQASLAANNRWPALKALQDILIGGIYPPLSASADSSSGNKTIEYSEHIAKIHELEKELEHYRKAPEPDIEQAKASGFNIKQGEQHDFTIVEGIGPGINELIHNADIHTYFELARTDKAVIQKILDDAGPNFQLAKPGTWPAQSEMAATNRWDALRKWQDELDGGKE